ncbi:carbohydrate kinase family protein [Bifidobacterium choloepi]|uniref:Carbohydrate kinase n=1 Tax=Bifidobacterium choloepi TaxID=2614131 RepID=A0A6I5N0R4_9BIFI|nr:carbohydrate kinase [Bifidobacterium choloepi]NEG70056.1 carbohydrate kinase [Bifidobacterium choloepi]
MPQPTVVSLGELLWDMLPDGKRAGGAPVNFAYHAMKNGTESHSISAIGNDELGDELATAAAQAGIDAVLQRNAWPTGTVEVALRNGIPEYTIVEDVAWDHLEATPELEELVARADAICYGTLGLRSPAAHDAIVDLLAAAKPEALTFFDINLRGDFYSKELIEELLGYAKVFKINDEELEMLRGMFGFEDGLSDDDIARRFIERFGLDYLILTGGSTFSSVYAKDGSVSTLATPLVEVADTVGAGDSFSGTFTGRLLTGSSMAEAHRAAVNTAAYVCTQTGAWPDYPAEIPDYLKMKEDGLL